MALQAGLGAAGFAVQRVALDVADHMPVGADLVHVACAVAEPAQLPPAGQAAVGAVAQRIVAVGWGWGWPAAAWGSRCCCTSSVSWLSAS